MIARDLMSTNLVVVPPEMPVAAIAELLAARGISAAPVVDEAGALACMRHAQKKVVTVAIDSMTFRQPIRIGDLIILNAEVTYTGKSSMEAEVHVVAENPVTGEQTHTNTAYLVYVALDDEGRPTSVPALIVDTEEERQRMEQAKERQQRRISQK